jgi:hypothetical protein
MKSTRLLLSALSATLLVSGCWASKEETASQLQRHVDAYRKVKVTPGNAKQVIKGADLLLSKSESNRFSRFMRFDQERSLNDAKLLATKVVECTDSVDAWMQSNPKHGWKDWKPTKSDGLSSSELAGQAKALEGVASCDELVTRLDSGQKSELGKQISAVSALVAEREKEEDEKKRQEELAQKLKEAEELRQKCRNAFADAEKARKEFLIYSNAGSSGDYGWASSMDYSSRGQDAWNELTRIREFISDNCR